MFYLSNWWIITVIRVGLNTLASNDQSAAQNLCHFRLALRQELQFLTVLLVQIEQHLLIASRQNELLLVYFQHSVCFLLFVVVAHLLFHNKFKVVVVNCERVLPLNQDWVIKRVQRGKADLKFMDLFKSVLGCWVDRVNWEFLIGHDVKFGFIGHFRFFNFAI